MPTPVLIHPVTIGRDQKCRTVIEGNMVEIVDANEMQWFAPPAGHREPGVEFKHLFTGEEGQSNNYWLTLVQVREHYHTPPHRHMFDQVRYMIKGGFNFGAQEQPEGSVGYFTEGTTYEQSCDSYSYHLLLQVEGASRSKYFSGKSLRAATDTLKQEGHFEKGRFHYSDGREVDGYEAIYQQLTGESVRYTEPRYERPVIMQPELFVWTPDPVHPGIRRRRLGSFNERELGLYFVGISAGSTFVFSTADDGRTLAYVVKGTGQADGQAWGEGCGLRFFDDIPVTLTATTDSEIFMIAMPQS
jgi:hypothetical protein